MMNAAASLFRRLNIRELVTGTPAYNTASGAYLVALFAKAYALEIDEMFRNSDICFLCANLRYFRRWIELDV